MAYTGRTANETTFGNSRAGNGPATVAINTPSGTASGIVLLDSAGTEYAVWVNTSGELIIGTRAGFTAPNTVAGNATSKKVGAQ